VENVTGNAACGSCSYFEPVDKTCHRNAPTPRVNADIEDFFWPEVGERDWCGEYTVAKGRRRRKPAVA